MNDPFFSKMPCCWQTQPSEHQKIAATDKGRAIVALKLYIALCLKANFKARVDFPITGCVQRSVTQLCELVGASRPMVIDGLRTLAQWKFVECKGGRPTVYRISDYETSPNWTKLPKKHLYGSHKEKQILRLIDLPNRRRGTLHALQMYLYVASIRDRKTNKAKVTYDRLTAVLGITRNEVSKAISTLVASELLSVRVAKHDEFSQEEFASNIYWLRGSITDENDEEARKRWLKKVFPNN